MSLTVESVIELFCLKGDQSMREREGFYVHDCLRHSRKDKNQQRRGASEISPPPASTTVS
jgi:hypothetical protein